MRKMDLLYLLIFAIGEIVLLIETWIGLELAVEILAGWTIFSLIAFIFIMRDYVVVHTYTETSRR